MAATSIFWLMLAQIGLTHTLVQTLTDNVTLRGRVLGINFLAVVVLAGHVALLALEGQGL